MLQQRIHGHHQEAPRPPQHDEKGHGQPQVVDEVHQNHQHAHGDAQRHDARGHVQPHAHRGSHRPTAVPMATTPPGPRPAWCCSPGRQRPGQHDVAQVARDTPEQGGGGQRDLAQPVVPQALVALPEIGHQHQGIGQHTAFGSAAGDASRPLSTECGCDPCRNGVDDDQRRNGRLGRRVHPRSTPGTSTISSREEMVGPTSCPSSTPG